MRSLGTLLSAAGFAALAAFATTTATAATAAPLGAAKVAVGDTAGQVQPIHYRGYRHCHRNDGRKWCHGGYSRRYYDGYRYGYRPGIYLRFGFGGDRDRHYKRRYCEGFRMTALTDAAMGTRAVVGKPPVKEPAGLWASRCLRRYGD